MHNLWEAVGQRLWHRFPRSLQRWNRLDELERFPSKRWSGSRFPMARVSGVSDYRPRHLTFLLRACGCGRARVGDFARAGGFRARRGGSRAPGGCSRAPGGCCISCVASVAVYGLKMLSKTSMREIAERYAKTVVFEQN